MEGFQSLRGNLSPYFGHKLNNFGIIENRKKVYCYICKTSFSYLGNVSSLNFHLQAKHPFVYQNGKFKALSKKGENNPDAFSSKQNDAIDSLSESSIITTKQNEIANAIAMWIISSLRPISLVEDKGLEEILQIALGSKVYCLPAKSIVLSKINQIFLNEKEKLEDDLDAVEHVSLTGVFWTSLTDELYLDVMAHWIDSCWQFRSKLLKVKNVPKHTTEQYNVAFSEMARDWKLLDKLQAICSDYNCTLISGNDNKIINTVKCAAEALNACITKALNVASVSRILSQWRLIIEHFKHNSESEKVLLDKLNELNIVDCNLQIDIPSRWKTSYFMITTILGLKEAIEGVLSKCLGDNSVSWGEKWEMLIKLQDVLEPCLVSSNLLGGEKFAPSSVVIPALIYLKNKMSVVESNSNSYINHFKSTLCGELTKVLAHWPYYENYEIATALDPRFKSLLCIPTEKREAVWQRLANLESVNDSDNESLSAADVPKPKKRKLFATDSTQQDCPRSPENLQSLNSLSSEISVYRSMVELDDDFSDPLEWWKLYSLQLPNLAKIAKKFLCIPATATPCEQLNSRSGLITDALKTTLGNEEVSTLLCLKDWLGLPRYPLNLDLIIDDSDSEAIGLTLPSTSNI